MTSLVALFSFRQHCVVDFFAAIGDGVSSFFAAARDIVSRPLGAAIDRFARFARAVLNTGADFLYVDFAHALADGNACFAHPIGNCVTGFVDAAGDAGAGFIGTTGGLLAHATGGTACGGICVGMKRGECGRHNTARPQELKDFHGSHNEGKRLIIPDRRQPFCLSAQPESLISTGVFGQMCVKMRVVIGLSRAA